MNFCEWLFACGAYENHTYAFNSWFNDSPAALAFCAILLGGIVAVCVNKKLWNKFF